MYFKNQKAMVEHFLDEGVGAYIGGGAIDTIKEIGNIADVFKHDWEKTQDVLNDLSAYIKEHKDMDVDVGGMRGWLDSMNTHHNWAHIYFLNDGYFNKVKEGLKKGETAKTLLANADFDIRKLDKVIGSPKKVGDLEKVVEKFRSRVEQLSAIKTKESFHYLQYITLTGARTLGSVVRGVVRASM
jgi:DNA polymerase II small subunit/DNA polymerase delta subunit B